MNDMASKENVERVAMKSLPPLSSQVSEVKTPLKENRNYINTRVTTPTMSPRKDRDDPMSPTANLKLLTHMASLEKSRESRHDVTEETSQSNNGGRKDKSLALLCTRFMQKYREYPESGTIVTISLDEAAKELSVERRRIYDIVNVFESIEMMRRVAKNCYTWYGKSNLKNVLARLALLARIEGLSAQYEAVFSLESAAVPMTSPSVLDFDSCENSTDGSSIASPVVIVDEKTAQSRKEKSLGLMSQKFLKLFLAVKPKVVSLEVAARILVGDATTEELKCTAYKTKIRRLYDIANILTSLQLIRKVHVTHLCMRKPAFEYVGPEVDSILSLDAVPSSLSDRADRFKRSQSDTPTGGDEVKLPRTRSETFFRSPPSSSTATTTTPFIRHASLQDVCEVAAEERRKFSGVDDESMAPVAKPSNKHPATAILMSQDGRPIHVITIATTQSMSTDHVTLQLASQQSSSSSSSSSSLPSTVVRPATTTSGQLVFELPFVLQFPSHTGLARNETECHHHNVVIDTATSGDANHIRSPPSGSTHAAVQIAVSASTPDLNIGRDEVVSGGGRASAQSTSVMLRNIFRPNILSSSSPNLLSNRRRPFPDPVSATSSTPTSTRNLEPPELELRLAQTPVIRYHRSSPLPRALKNSDNEDDQTPYSLVSKKLRM